MDNKVLAQNMPVSTTLVNTVVDYAHLGVDVSSKEITRKLHNRATTTFRLRDFSDSNLKSCYATGGKYLRHSCSKKIPTGRTCGSEGRWYYTH